MKDTFAILSWNRFLAVFLATACLPLWADIITLKSNDTLEGNLIELTEDYLRLDLFTEERKIPRAEISRIDLGYTGVNACVRLKKDLTESCDYLLHRLLPKSVILASGKGYLKAKLYKKSEVATLSFKKKGSLQKLIPVLKKSVELELVDSTGRQNIGMIDSTSPNELVFLTKDNIKLNFRETDLVSGNWMLPPAPSPYRFTRWVIPGLEQTIRGHYWKAGALFLAAAGFAGGIGYSYEKANQALLNDTEYIFFNDQIFATSNFIAPATGASYHYNRMLGFGAGLGLVYALHTVDWVWGEDDPDKTASLMLLGGTQLVGQGIPVQGGWGAPLPIWGMKQEQSLELRLSFRF